MFLQKKLQNVVDLEMSGMMIFKIHIFLLLHFEFLNLFMYLHLLLDTKHKHFKPKFDKITKNWSMIPTGKSLIQIQNPKTKYSMKYLMWLTMWSKNPLLLQSKHCGQWPSNTILVKFAKKNKNILWEKDLHF